MTPTLSQDRPRIGADAFTLEGIMKSLLERNKRLLSGWWTWVLYSGKTLRFQEALPCSYRECIKLHRSDPRSPRQNRMHSITVVSTLGLACYANTINK